MTDLAGSTRTDNPGSYRLLLPRVARRWRALLLILILSTTGPLLASLSPWPMKVLADNALGGGATAADPAASTILDRLTLPENKTTLVLLAAGASLGLFIA